MRTPELPRYPDWMLDAACRTVADHHVFFPERYRSADAVEAKAVCAGCPVQLKCLGYGLDEDYGIWGGLDEEERRELRGPKVRRKTA